MSEKLDLINQWFKRVWSEQDVAAIDEMFREDGYAEGLGADPLQGPAEFKQFHAALCGLLTDFVFTVNRCVEQGDWASAHCTMVATSRASGEQVKIDGNVLVRIEKNTIMEGYNQFDFLGLWSQLGYLPKDAFALGLSGHKIA